MARRLRRLLLDSPEGAWLALALALRLAFALKLGSAYYQADEHGFEGLALQLARTGVFGVEGRPSAGAVAPAAFFALAFRLFGESRLAARLAQAFVGTFVAAAVGRSTAALARSREAGRLALVLACVYPFFVYYGGMLMSETVYLALTVPALALLGLGLRDESAARLGGGGFLLGLAALARPEAAPIGLLVLATAAASRFEARAARPLALAALCWSLPILGWSARNLARVGAFTLDTHGGVTLLHGTKYFDANEIDTSEAVRAYRADPLSARAEALPEAERDRVLKRAALDWIVSHPAETARQIALKTVGFWRFYPRVDKAYPDEAGARPAAGARRWALVATSLLFEPWLVLGGLAGLWALRREAALRPASAFVIGTMGVHVLSVSQMRYRLPTAPWLIVGACALAARALAPQSEKR